ncbi:GNAT family N-acetyltransferase [Minwuia sp.]|uniref:GNAT family N-acetyltransferase n=1 Tax=Minwuia sp. TaxID=2493630 RepID=UPI003A8CC143
MGVRPARPDEHAQLTDLALRSKAHWGYSEDFMAACVDELTLTPALITERMILLLEDESGRILGMGGLAWDEGVLEVCDMFVEPAHIGKGAGKVIFQALVEAARKTGASGLRIDADPNALPFYLKMGARQTGSAPSGSIAGRRIPRLILDL